MTPARKAQILAALATLPNHFKTEARLQSAVAQVLTDLGANFVEEFRFTTLDRVDFLIGNEGDGLDSPAFCVECKVQGSALAISRQLHRYAAHTAELVLVSAKATGIGSGEIVGRNGNRCLLHVLELWRNPV